MGPMGTQSAAICNACGTQFAISGGGGFVFCDLHDDAA